MPRISEHYNALVQNYIVDNNHCYPSITSRFVMGIKACYRSLKSVEVVPPEKKYQLPKDSTTVSQTLLNDRKVADESPHNSTVSINTPVDDNQKSSSTNEFSSLERPRQVILAESKMDAFIWSISGKDFTTSKHSQGISNKDIEELNGLKSRLTTANNAEKDSEEYHNAKEEFGIETLKKFAELQLDIDILEYAISKNMDLPSIDLQHEKLLAKIKEKASEINNNSGETAEQKARLAARKKLFDNLEKQIENNRANPVIFNPTAFEQELKTKIKDNKPNLDTFKKFEHKKSENHTANLQANSFLKELKEKTHHRGNQNDNYTGDKETVKPEPSQRMKANTLPPLPENPNKTNQAPNHKLPLSPIELNKNNDLLPPIPSPKNEGPTE